MPRKQEMNICIWYNKADNNFPLMAHHIVAKTAREAVPARTIYQNKTKHNINGTANLVNIKTGLHRRFHSNEYYSFVNYSLGVVYNKKNSFAVSKKNVSSVVSTIKDSLVAISAISPF